MSHPKSRRPELEEQLLLDAIILRPITPAERPRYQEALTKQSDTHFIMI